MGRKSQKSESDKKEHAASGPEARDEKPRHGVGERKSQVSRPSVWIETRRPILRFVTLFVVLMGPFTLFFYGALTQESMVEPYLHVNAVFESYLDLNAAVSAGILRVLGEQATSSGQSLRSPRSSLEIRFGCDAILPTALFVSAVLAFPVTMRSKWSAVFLGSGMLLLINLVRIITLYYTRIHRPDWFHAMHVDIWQPAFIFLALFFWVMWALRATRVPAVQDDPST